MSGCRVSLIVGRDFEPSPDWNLGDVGVVMVRHLVKHIDPAKDIVTFLRLARSIRSLGPDLVDTHLAKAGVLGRLAARVSNVRRIVHTVHGPTFPGSTQWPLRKLFFVLEWLCGKVACDHFVFVGRELMETYVRAGICDPLQASVIRTGFRDWDSAVAIGDTDRGALRRELCGGRDCDLLLLCVGRIVPAKGQEDAIEVLRRMILWGIDCHLCLAGEALVREEVKYKQRLLDVIQSLGLGERVHMLGHREDVLRIMVAADALLITSRYEGLPNVAVEAAVVGIPIIAYDAGGVREVVQEGCNGFIVPVGAVDKMAERAASFLYKGGLVERGSGNLGCEVAREYSRDTMVQMTLELYARLLG